MSEPEEHMRTLSELLYSYIDSYRDLVNLKNWSSYRSPKQLLGLNKEEDWTFICTAMDIVGDALSAIDNFLQFGLDGPTKYNNVGEKYLRLYGVLNATYIQQQAVFNLYKLNNVPDPKKIKKKIDRLKIREVRNKIGSHSNDYINFENDNKIESYVPIRIMLIGYNCEYLNNETLKNERVNLKELLEEHLRLLLDLLDQIYEKSVYTFYRNNKSQLSELEEKLKYLRIEKDGGIVIDTEIDDTKIVITTMKNKI